MDNLGQRAKELKQRFYETDKENFEYVDWTGLAKYVEVEILKARIEEIRKVPFNIFTSTTGITWSRCDLIFDLESNLSELEKL